MSEEREQYGDYSVDDEDQPGAEDTLRDELDPDDLLDTGYSPPERYSPDYGNTAWEATHRQTIEQRMRQEIPDSDPYGEDDWSEDEDADGEVGDRRAGRLVEPDEGVREDDEKDMIASDVGIDGAGASAEEAAIHVVPDEWER